jgi:EpsD family peptidyl-prolyl cis-trans isomerase
MRMTTASTRPWGLSRGLTVLLMVLLALQLSACGERRKDRPATQPAAKVNGDEVTVQQINLALQQRNLRPEQADAASRQVLERLVDQTLAVQKADELKLDREARVIQQVEAARREILARAYADKVGEAAAKPTAEDVHKVYEEKPALFKERRIYNLQEIAIEARPDQVATLKEKLGTAKNIGEFIEHLKAQELRFVPSQAVRAAEQLPLSSLEAFSRMKDGQAILVPNASGAQVIVVAGSRSQPVSEEQARPAIEQFLLNERKKKLIEEDLKAMRAAAKIEYVGKFGEGAPGAASAPAGTATPPAAPAATPAPAASTGLSANEISKGMGLK